MNLWYFVIRKSINLFSKLILYWRQLEPFFFVLILSCTSSEYLKDITKILIVRIWSFYWFLFKKISLLSTIWYCQRVKLITKVLSYVKKKMPGHLGIFKKCLWDAEMDVGLRAFLKSDWWVVRWTVNAYF